VADEILFSLKDGVATITMNRPEKRNALNTVLLEGFNRILAHVEESQEARVVVIRGEGKAFCSGIDLRELSSRQTGHGDPEVSVVQIFQRIERSRIPTIAMVHGDALAGGCELALHCDLRVAAEPARTVSLGTETGGDHRSCIYQANSLDRATDRCEARLRNRHGSPARDCQ
jgi:enoyl-CoA hydratase/carnithine racemase